MQLSKFDIQGYKSIHENQRMEFEDFNVLFGENNVGKSSIIAALQDYRDIFPVASQVDSGWAHSRNTGKEPEGEIRFELEFILNEQEHSEFINKLEEVVEVGERQVERWKENDDLRRITHELVLHSSRDSTEPLSGESNVYGNFQDDEIVLRKGGLTEKNAKYVKYRKISQSEFTDRRKGWVPLLDIMTKSLESWKVIEAFREPSNRMPAQRELDLDGTGMNLSQVLLTLRGEDGGEFERISKEYAKIMSGVSGIRAQLPVDNKTTVVVDEDAFETGFELSEISAGSKEVLTLITQIVLAEDGTDLLLVEEPELHLHPGAERRVLDLIREVISSSTSNDLQAIVSTHSNIFVHHLDVDNIYRVERDINTSISPTASTEVGADLRDLGYEYAGMFQSEAVVIVEGLTDRVALRTVGRRCGLDFDEYNIGILEMGSGSQLVKHSRPVVRLLNLFNIPFIFLCDSDIGEDLKDEHGNPAESPQEIEGRLAGHLNNDTSRYSSWDKEEPKSIHAWREEELEYYLLQDHERVADCFGRLEKEDVEQILEENKEETPDDQLKAICRKARPELNYESDPMEKKTDISDISESVRLGTIPSEFYDVLEQIADLVDVKHIVSEARPERGDE